MLNAVWPYNAIDGFSFVKVVVLMWVQCMNLVIGVSNGIILRPLNSWGRSTRIGRWRLWSWAMGEGRMLHEAHKCLWKKLILLSARVIWKFKFHNCQLIHILWVKFVVAEHGKVSLGPVEEPGRQDLLAWLLGSLPTALGAQTGEDDARQVSWTSYCLVVYIAFKVSVIWCSEFWTCRPGSKKTQPLYDRCCAEGVWPPQCQGGDRHHP